MQAVHQVTVDSDGNEIVLDVRVYTKTFMRALRPISGRAHTPLNYAQQYVANLDPALRHKLESKYTTHLINHDRSRKVQFETLNVVKREVIKCDKCLNSIHSMINQQKTDFNGMICQVMSVITKKPDVSFMPAGSDDIDVTTFVSQAEKCISDNGGGKMPSDTLSQFHDNGCWGCGSKDHVWWNKVT